MHEGHHGILDGINEEHEHKHNYDHKHGHDHNHDHLNEHSKKTPSNTLNLWKTVGVIALSVVLILFFRIIFSK